MTSAPALRRRSVDHESAGSMPRPVRRRRPLLVAAAVLLGLVVWLVVATGLERASERVQVWSVASEVSPDPRRGPEHHLDDLLQLAVRRRPRRSWRAAPTSCGISDGVDLLKSQRHGLRRRLVHPGNAADRVLLQSVVPDCQTEGEAENRPRLLGRAVALGGRKLLNELVDLAHIDLAEGVGLEGGHYELAHVALVERTRARRKLVGEIEIREPHLDKTTERTVARQVSAAGGKAITTRELLLECPLRRLASHSRRLDESKLSIVVAEAHARLDPAVGRRNVGELAEGADRGAWSSHLRSPSVPIPTGPNLALGLDPGEHVALDELHMTPDTDAAWTLAVDTPVVNGRDWHPEVLRKVLDAEQRVEPTEWMRLGLHDQ